MSAPASTAVLPDGLVLSGGAGTRVGGRDKGLLPGVRRSAAGEAIELLRPYCGRVFVSANRNLDRYRALGSDGVIEDLRAGHRGPLAGIEAARATLDSDCLLMLPCDTSGIPADLPGRLLEALRADASRDLVHLHAAGRDQYLIAALRRRALCGVSLVLDQGRGAVREWLTTLNTGRLHLDETSGAALRNRNHSADWDE